MGEWLLDVLGTAGVATLLVAAGAWLAREWIAQRLGAALREKTEKKLAAFQARLDAAEAQVSAVRAAGIEALHQSNAAALTERVRATHAMWGAVVAWHRASALSMFIAGFKTNEAIATAAHAPSRENFKMMLETIKHEDLQAIGNAVEVWRPFVSENAWALYAVLNAFYNTRLTKATMLKLGKKEMVERLWLVNSELQMIKNTTTPEIAAQYESDEFAGSVKALAFIETALMAELKRALAGDESGPETARQAAKVLEVAEAATTTAAEMSKS